MSKEQQTQEQTLESFRQVAVIGLGLIGGSLAKALKKRAGVQLVALDCNRQSLDQALAEAVVDVAGLVSEQTADDLELDRPSWQLIQNCQLVFVCTPVDQVVATVEKAAHYCSGLITDVAGIKAPIMKQVTVDRFIGGHPMAGSERQGYRFSSDSLFENAVYAWCSHANTSLSHSWVLRFETLIQAIGAIPIHMAAQAHDQAVAAVSHLPHVVASALCQAVARQDQGLMARLAAGGFRDITRIASSDPALWTQLCLQSREHLLPMLSGLQAVLEAFHTAIDQEQATSLEELFFGAARYRDQLPVSGRGALSAHSLLTVQVSDKPGVLGHITTLLGDHGINISNIRILEQRPYEGGCLQLLLSDGRQANQAAWLLKEAGYVCD